MPGLGGLIIVGPLAKQLPTLAALRSQKRATLHKFAHFALGREGAPPL